MTSQSQAVGLKTKHRLPLLNGKMNRKNNRTQEKAVAFGGPRCAAFRGPRTGGWFRQGWAPGGEPLTWVPRAGCLQTGPSPSLLTHSPGLVLWGSGTVSEGFFTAGLKRGLRHAPRPQRPLGRRPRQTAVTTSLPGRRGGCQSSRRGGALS